VLRASEQVIGDATLRSGPEMGDHTAVARAYCPLCNGSSKQGYAKGFTVPEGLRRHLLGVRTAKQCPVVHQAVDATLKRILA
jgi:hypothetical protein